MDSLVTESDLLLLALLSLYFIVYFINRKHNSSKQEIKEKQKGDCPPHSWVDFDGSLKCKKCNGIITDDGDIYYV